MLQLHQRTSAPSAVSVSISTAVCTVMCSEPVMRAPASGWESVYSARMAIRPGISCSASWICLRPSGARERSATLKSVKLMVPPARPARGALGARTSASVDVGRGWGRLTPGSLQPSQRTRVTARRREYDPDDRAQVERPLFAAARPPLLHPSGPATAAKRRPGARALISSSTGTGPGSTSSSAAICSVTSSPIRIRSNSCASAPSPFARISTTSLTISSQISATSSKRRCTCGCSWSWRNSTIVNT